MSTGEHTRWRSYFGVLVLVILISCGSARAQSSARPEATSSVESGRVPGLSSALMSFAAENGIDILYDPELVSHLRAGANATHGTREQQLRQILQGTGLTFSQLSSGTFVLRPERSPRVSAGSIRGEVVDRVTGQGIPSAHVLLAEERRAGATDAHGRFAFEELRAGTYRIMATHIGYGVRIDTVVVAPAEVTHSQIRLATTSIDIAPLVVEDTRGVAAAHARSRIMLSRMMERSATGISPDIVRSLNSMMGIRVGDALADVHVQGSEAGEHQFKLDGVPVFEPVHLRGLIGAFNPFAINRVLVHKAGFGAEHGSHLAGVIAAEHALIPTEGRLVDAQIDPLSLSARVHGSTGLGGRVEASFMVAARTSLWSVYPEHLYPSLKNLLRDWNTPDSFLPQAWLVAFEQVDPEIAQWFRTTLDSLDYTYTSESDPELGFNDLHLAGSAQFSQRHRLYGSFYRGWNRLNGNRLSVPFDAESVGLNQFAERQARSDDRAEAAHRDDYQWVNMIGQVRHDFLLSSRSLLRTRIRTSRYSLTHSYNALAQGSVQIFALPDGWAAIRLVEDVGPTDNGNGIRELALESTFDHDVSAAVGLTAGAELVQTRYRFAIEDVSDYQPLSDSSSSWRLAFFAQSDAAFTPRLRLTAGTRFTSLPHRGDVYLEPRAEVRYQAPTSYIGAWSAWVGGGLYRQFVNQFNVSSVSPSVLLPAIRFWLPIDASVSPPRAYHLAGGVELQPSSWWTGRAEAYYKHQPRLLFIDYVALWSQRRSGAGTDDGQSSFLHAGRGYGYGGAVSVEREDARTHVLARYEYSVARRSRTLLARASSGTSGTERAHGFEPVPWNEPHALEAALNWRATRRISVMARWRSYWGRTWAFRQSYYDYLATDPLLSPNFRTGGFDLRHPEEHRLAAFHQLDLSAAFAFSAGPTICQMRVDLINALDRRNEADWTLQLPADAAGSDDYRVVARTMLPRTPSATVRLKW